MQNDCKNAVAVNEDILLDTFEDYLPRTAGIESALGTLVLIS